jgi:hypothetical protein
MLVGIHQPHYLPWLRYFEKIARSDVFIVLDDIQFSKNGWQNRNKIKSATGPLLLTVPVVSKNRQLLHETRINNATDWAQKHWKTLKQCYGPSPFFDSYAPFLEETYTRSWTFLKDLNRHMLTFFVGELGIDSPIVYASELNVPGSATGRLINLIRAVGGDRYYSGAYALDAYLDAEAFADAGIDLDLQQWEPRVYAQRHGDFVPDLAIIDLLMNEGPQSLDCVLSGGSGAR